MNKLRKAKFSILCDVTSVVRLEEKFKIDHSAPCFPIYSHMILCVSHLFSYDSVCSPSILILFCVFPIYSHTIMCVPHLHSYDSCVPYLFSCDSVRVLLSPQSQLCALKAEEATVWWTSQTGLSWTPINPAWNATIPLFWPRAGSVLRAREELSCPRADRRTNGALLTLLAT